MTLFDDGSSLYIFIAKIASHLDYKTKRTIFVVRNCLLDKMFHKLVQQLEVSVELIVPTLKTIHLTLNKWPLSFK